MRGLDDTDRDILELLLEDSRRPFSKIGERVDLSAPAVSDRVDRLEELGVIRGFTLDIDRTKLQGDTPVVVTIQCDPGTGSTIRETLEGTTVVQHLLQTADDTIVCTIFDTPDIGSFLSETLPHDSIREYEVRILESFSWTPLIGDAQLHTECVECGNTVTNDGTSERLDGERYHFCCPSCKERFVQQYEELKEGA